MTATLQIDDLHTLIDHPATRHVLDAKDFGTGYADPQATVTLYQLIPLQSHEQPWIVRVELHDEGTERLEAFDYQGEAEAAYARQVDRMTDRYGDDEDDDSCDEDCTCLCHH